MSGLGTGVDVGITGAKVGTNTGAKVGTILEGLGVDTGVEVGFIPRVGIMNCFLPLCVCCG